MRALGRALRGRGLQTVSEVEPLVTPGEEEYMQLQPEQFIRAKVTRRAILSTDGTDLHR